MELKQGGVERESNQEALLRNSSMQDQLEPVEEIFGFLIHTRCCSTKLLKDDILDNNYVCKSPLAAVSAMLIVASDSYYFHLIGIWRNNWEQAFVSRDSHQSQNQQYYRGSLNSGCSTIIPRTQNCSTARRSASCCSGPGCQF